MTVYRLASRTADAVYFLAGSAAGVGLGWIAIKAAVKAFLNVGGWR